MALRPDHPDIDDLLGYRNGSLSENDRNRVQAHLAECAACARELEQIAGSGTSPMPTAHISDLLSNLAQVQDRLTREGVSGESLKRRVLSELIPYVGTAPAERILEPVTPGGENLLSTIEPMLRLFLGRTASARLVDRIVDRAIMRT
jgi:hypothetical protein